MENITFTPLERIKNELLMIAATIAAIWQIVGPVIAESDLTTVDGVYAFITVVVAWVIRARAWGPVTIEKLRELGKMTA